MSCSLLQWFMFSWHSQLGLSNQIYLLFQAEPWKHSAADRCFALCCSINVVASPGSVAQSHHSQVSLALSQHSIAPSHHSVSPSHPSMTGAGEGG